MKSSRLGGVMAAAAALAAMAGLTTNPATRAPVNEASAVKQGSLTRGGAPADRNTVPGGALEAVYRSIYGRAGGDPRGGYRKRPPGSNARTIRAAAKRRNVMRNRKAHRG